MQAAGTPAINLATAHPALQAVDLLVQKWNPAHRMPQPVAAGDEAAFALMSLPSIDWSGWMLRGLDVTELGDAELSHCDLRGCAAFRGNKVLDGRFLLRERVASGAMSVWPRLQAPLIAPWPGHLGRIDGLVRAGKAPVLASGGQDGLACLWLLQDDGMAQPLARIAAHAEPLIALSIAENGRRFVTASNEGDAVWWQLQPDRRCTQLHRIKVARGQLVTLALHPGGEVLAVATRPGEIEMLGLVEGKAQSLARLRTEGDPSLVAFSPDGRWLVSGHEDGRAEIRRWRWPEGGLSSDAEVRFPSDARLQRVTFSADSTMLASAEQDGRIRVWNLSHEGRLTEQATLAGSGRLSWGVSISSVGNGELHVTAAGDDGNLRWWSRRTAGESFRLQTLLAHLPAVRGVALDSAGRHLATCGDDGSVRLWSLGRQGNAHCVDVLGPAEDRVAALAFRPGTQSLFVAGAGRELHRWTVLDTGLASSERAPESLPGAARDIAISADGSRLACVDALGEVRLWNLLTDEPASLITSMSGSTGIYSRLAWSPDATRLAITSERPGVQLWSLPRDAPPSVLPALNTGDESLSCVAFRGDGRLLAAGGQRGISVWPIDANGLMAPTPARTELADWQMCLAFSPDGKRLASGSLSGQLSLWSVSDKGELTRIQEPLAKHEEWIAALAFSPDGRWLASAGRSGHIVLLELSPGGVDSAALRLEGQGAWITSLAFSPDGQLLASADTQGVASLWRRDATNARRWQRAWCSIGRGVALLDPDNLDQWKLARLDGKPWITETRNGEELPADPLLYPWLWFTDPDWGSVPAYDVPPSWLQWSSDRKVLAVQRAAFAEDQLRAGFQHLLQKG